MVWETDHFEIVESVPQKEIKQGFSRIVHVDCK
jgi:hypothetical protein